MSHGIWNSPIDILHERVTFSTEAQTETETFLYDHNIMFNMNSTAKEAIIGVFSWNLHKLNTLSLDIFRMQL